MHTFAEVSFHLSDVFHFFNASNYFLNLHNVLEFFHFQLYSSSLVITESRWVQ